MTTHSLDSTNRYETSQHIYQAVSDDKGLLIKGSRLYAYPIQLIAPIRAVYGEVLIMDTFILEVETTTGIIGYGEASNIYRPDQEGVEQVVADIRSGISSLPKGITVVSLAQGSEQYFKTHTARALVALAMATVRAPEHLSSWNTSEPRKRPPLYVTNIHFECSLDTERFFRGHSYIKVKVNGEDSFKQILEQLSLIARVNKRAPVVSLDANGTLNPISAARLLAMLAPVCTVSHFEEPFSDYQDNLSFYEK